MIRHFATLGLAALLAVPVTGVINHVVPGGDVAFAANRVRLTVTPNQDRYRRGTNIEITGRVVGPDGRPVVNTPILVQEIYYDPSRRRTVDRVLANATTNHEGRYTIHYQVPTDPNKDNIVLTFVNPVPGGDSQSFRIPIGR